MVDEADIGFSGVVRGEGHVGDEGAVRGEVDMCEREGRSIREAKGMREMRGRMRRDEENIWDEENAGDKVNIGDEVNVGDEVDVWGEEGTWGILSEIEATEIRKKRIPLVEPTGLQVDAGDKEDIRMRRLKWMIETMGMRKMCGMKTAWGCG
ncbi:hypothetical protein BDQ17DRAFT_1336058 [Cyathus striatus]|nr:hypothetical protein BDQ17DRAFT_1336058 [Cyathus striatus]